MFDPVERDIAKNAEEQDKVAAIEAEGEEAWDALRRGDGYGGIDIEAVDEAISDCEEIGTIIREAVVSGNYDKLKDRVDGVINQFIDRELGLSNAA